MEYEVNSEVSYDFENVKKITIGSGRLYYVYRNDIPYVYIEVNLLDCSEHFIDSIIIGDNLLIGNYYEGVYIIDLIDFQVEKISVDGYFGYFVVNKEFVYILGCEKLLH